MLIEIKLFKVYFERKLRPNKMEAEATVFCWLRFRLQLRNGRFRSLDLNINH